VTLLSNRLGVSAHPHLADRNKRLMPADAVEQSPMKTYVVTYTRTPIRLPSGRMTTDSFQVVDRSATPSRIVSEHATRAAAVAAAEALRAG
jgi:hypothetical protein